MPKRSHSNSSDEEDDYRQGSKKIHRDSREKQTQRHYNGDSIKNQKESQQEAGRIQKFVQNRNLCHALRKKGINSLFPVQYSTYNLIMDGKDVVARDRTGSGKTLAFVLPILDRFSKSSHQQISKHYPRFLIVLPTRQLVIQVKTQIQSLQCHQSFKFKVIAVYGQSDINYQISYLKSGVDIVVATPGRLLDLLNREAIDFQAISVVCLDQADQMLKQGFQEDVQKIFDYIKKHTQNKKPQTLLFSATIPDWLKELSQKYQTQPKYINMIKNDAIRTATTLKHYCLEIDKFRDQQSQIIEKLINQYGCQAKRCLIFCQTKRDVKQLGMKLRIPNHQLHGDITQNKRQYAFRQFKQGSIKCLIATNVAARGLDFPAIDIVIQTQPPKNIQPYIHRAGRTARAGKTGCCVTMFDRKVRYLIDRIQRQANIIMTKLYVKDLMDSRGQPQHRRLDRDQYGRDKQNQIQRGSYSDQRFPPPTSSSRYDLRFPPPLPSRQGGYKQRERSRSRDYSGQKNSNRNNDRHDDRENFSRNDRSDDRDRDRDRNRDRSNGHHASDHPNYSTRSSDLKGGFIQRPYELFVGSLSKSLNQKDVRDFFDYKGVQHVNFKLLKDEQGQSKGCGFLSCRDQNSKRKGLELDGCKFDDFRIRISVPKPK